MKSAMGCKDEVKMRRYSGSLEREKRIVYSPLGWISSSISSLPITVGDANSKIFFTDGKSSNPKKLLCPSLVLVTLLLVVLKKRHWP